MRWAYPAAEPSRRPAVLQDKNRRKLRAALPDCVHPALTGGMYLHFPSDPRRRHDFKSRHRELVSSKHRSKSCVLRGQLVTGSPLKQQWTVKIGKSMSGCLGCCPTARTEVGHLPRDESRPVCWGESVASKAPVLWPDVPEKVSGRWDMGLGPPRLLGPQAWRDPLISHLTRISEVDGAPSDVPGRWGLFSDIPADLFIHLALEAGRWVEGGSSQ